MKKLYLALRYVPFALASLLSVLLLTFFLTAPTVSRALQQAANAFFLNIGFFIPSSTQLDMEGYTYVAWMLATVFCIAYTACLGAFLFVPYLKGARVKRKRLADHSNLHFFFISAFIAVEGIIMLGVRLLTAGGSIVLLEAFPVLLILYFVLAARISGLALLARRVLAAIDPTLQRL